ncbi:L,D-transpeptidase family protein [Pedobacter punctiformis]|uniref:L,D-transpeptidase family protein n=1 Tax=Pedobacter punctiformis TaxID=3004097 RepID=A0ABT4L920_9SPHI|nr:L,D-transpeptidase family protein [Pedobacter sp. HCMS5-2]MCZ4244403.1 L,D-transpeptidase family protein [Pedobacter sp. HCMS5-2]
MKTLRLLILPCILIYLFAFKKEENLGQQLAKCLQNELYSQLDSSALDSVFVKTLDSLSFKLVNSKSLKKYYKDAGYSPNFILKFYENKELDSLTNYLNNSVIHGFNPKIFSVGEIKSLIEKLKLNNFKKVGDTYPTIAKLDILCADAYINYINYLKFGTVNPRKVIQDYYISIKQPDSLFIPGLLNSENITDTLRGVQNTSKQYTALQTEYLKCKNDSLRKMLAVNMERLRWRLPEMNSTSYVQVNIPDFKLVYFNNQDTLTSMKVCVGEQKDRDYEEKMKIYNKTGDFEDRPSNHETPILVSNINSLYTNPVWNIPESIAKTEVYDAVRKNRYYLKKSNIKVYYKDELMDPMEIRWWKYDRDKLPFTFVQESGLKNSLGKLKFAFPNRFSVYLHDTNYKNGFKLKNRAISHGCIRVEKPLKLAELLVSDQEKYNKMRIEVGYKPLDSAYMSLYENKVKAIAKSSDDYKLKTMRFVPKQETPILITYFTAWYQNNKIEYRSDVYGLDEKLWVAMKKFR